MPITPITLSDLTQAKVNGTGVFDVLMQANREHLEAEFKANRIKGPEYSQVYLGSLVNVLNTSVQFLLTKDKTALDALLIEKQIELAQVQVDKAEVELQILNASIPKVAAEIAQLEAQTLLVTQQTANALAELAIIQANATKIPAEVALLYAQTDVATQQKLNLEDEILTATKQREKIDQDILSAAAQVLQITAQKDLVVQQKANLVDELLTTAKQRLVMDTEIDVKERQIVVTEAQSTKDIAVKTAQITSMGKEDLVKDKQALMIQEQIDSETKRNEADGILDKEKAQLVAQTALVSQQATNTADELLTATKQRLVLDAEIDIKTAQLVSMSKEDDVKAAQALLIGQQKANLTDELLTTAKQRLKIDQEILNAEAQVLQTEAQAALIGQQKTNLMDELVTTEIQRDKLTQETTNLAAQKLQVDAQAALVTQQKLNLVDDLDTNAAQRTKITQETSNLVAQKSLVEAQTAMSTEQKESEALRNFVHPTDPTLSGQVEQERRVLLAQKCKLDAEFDVIMLTKDKTTNETALLAQKTATERAQTVATGVDENSVVGRQKTLYLAQTKGFKRDAEQKFGSMILDSWKVSKTVDGDNRQANSTNKLDDPSVGAAMTLLTAGLTDMGTLP